MLIFLTFTSYAEELTIITENAPPNSFIENGKLTGRTVEIVQATLKEIGLAGHSIKIYPWARGYLMLSNKKNIALFATTRSAQREDLFKWAGPIMDNKINLYKLKSRKDIKVNLLEDIKKYMVGGAIGDVKSQYLEAKGIKLDKVSQDIQNIKKLFHGRLEIIPYASARLNYDVRSCGQNVNDMEEIFYVKEISKQLYVAFSKQTDDSIVKRFQLGFDKIRENGTYEKIIQEWKDR